MLRSSSFVLLSVHCLTAATNQPWEALSLSLSLSLAVLPGPFMRAPIYLTINYYLAQTLRFSCPLQFPSEKDIDYGISFTCTS